MQPISIDLILHCRWLLPIIPKDKILEHYSVAIDGGRILELLPTLEAQSKYSGKETKQLGNQLVMPGLVNAHGHGSARLLRGIQNNLTSQQWLANYISNPESPLADSKFISDSINLAIAEMIKTGTTCFSETYSNGDHFIDAARKTGMRSQFNFIFQETPSIFGKDTDDYLHRGLKLRDNVSNHPLIKVGCGVTNINDIQETALKHLALLANELELPLQIQCNETAEDIQISERNSGHRPLQRLFNQGLLLPETQLIHMNCINAQDIDLIEKTNSHVVLCPEANQLLLNNTSSVEPLSKTAINLSIGTAGAASNNDFNLMPEIKGITLKLRASNSETAGNNSAHQALRMATINGAQALGWDEEIGSLEPGKFADLIAIEIDSIHHQPLYNLTTQLVQHCANNRITHSWVAGQPLLKDGVLCNFDEDQLISTAKDWGRRLAAINQ